MNALTSDIITLAVLRHHSVPTRLLDWSRSPLIATYFAALHHDDKDGEIWGFDEQEYMAKGIKQWCKPDKWADEFSNAAFNVDDVADFFVCITYLAGFGRQTAQVGYSVTSKFNCDHAERIDEALRRSVLAYPVYNSENSQTNTARQPTSVLWHLGRFAIPRHRGCSQNGRGSIH